MNEDNTKGFVVALPETEAICVIMSTRLQHDHGIPRPRGPQTDARIRDENHHCLPDSVFICRARDLEGSSHGAVGLCGVKGVTTGTAPGREQTQKL